MIIKYVAKAEKKKYGQFEFCVQAFKRYSHQVIDLPEDKGNSIPTILMAIS